MSHDMSYHVKASVACCVSESTNLANVFLHVSSFWMAFGIIEAGQADTIAIKAVVRAIDGDNGYTRISLGDASILLHTNNLAPYFIV